MSRCKPKGYRIDDDVYETAATMGGKDGERFLFAVVSYLFNGASDIAETLPKRPREAFAELQPRLDRQRAKRMREAATK